MKSSRVISTTAAPAAIGPYSQAVEAGGFLFLSGQIPLAPETGEVVEGDVSAQTRQILRNMANVLSAAGSNLTHIVKATIYLTNLDDFGEVNAVWAEAFPQSPPARACVEVSRLPKGVQVEVEAIATTPE